MDFIVLTDPGCEDACVQELATNEIEGSPGESTVTFSADLEAGCVFTYMTRTALRVLLFVEDLPLEGTFKATGDNIEETAAWVTEHTKLTVNLTNPDYTMSMHNERVCVDLGGALWKRDWRVMLSKRSLRATIAASAVLYAGVTPEAIVLDPFGDDGTLAIEASLLRSAESPRKYVKQFPFQKLCQPKLPKGKETLPVTVFTDSFHDVKAVRTNSKLAGVPVTTSKIPISWLDMKIAPKSIDIILTYPPASRKTSSVEKLLTHFFEQADLVLKPEGTITCVALKPTEIKEHATAFSLVQEFPVRMGNVSLAILTFRRQ